MPRMLDLSPKSFGPFTVDALKTELEKLKVTAGLNTEPSSPPPMLRVVQQVAGPGEAGWREYKFDGGMVRVIVGDAEYTLAKETKEGEVTKMLQTLGYAIYDEQNKMYAKPPMYYQYLALPGMGPFEKRSAAQIAAAVASAKEKVVVSEKVAAPPPPAPTPASATKAVANLWDATPAAQRDTAFLFPGQGTQKVDMEAKLLADPACRALFDEASKILGYDLVQLCSKGPQDKLDSTLYSQTAIMVCSLAAIEKVKKEDPAKLKKASVAAGFSLGEYTALVFAGALSFEDGVKLVKARAEAMDAAAKAGSGGMVSVSGCSDEVLQKALDQAGKAVGGGKKAYIANYMFPEGRTCSGDKAVCEKLCETAVKLGAKQAKMLAVSGAFHTPYMEAASEALGKALDEANVQMPSLTVYSNVTGKPYTSVDEIKTLLKRQMIEPVKWEQGTLDLIGLGCKEYIEPGPGKQLKAMMRRIDQDTWKKTVALD